VRDGAVIAIGLGARWRNVELPDSELRERRKAWTAPLPPPRRGWLARYARLVTNASKGAVLA